MPGEAGESTDCKRPWLRIFPTALQEGRLALPVVAWQDRMTQLCPAQALPDFNSLFSPDTGLRNH